MNKKTLISVLILIFSLIAYKVNYSNFELDLIVNQNVSKINQDENIKSFFSIIAWLGDIYGVILIASVLVIYFIYKKYYLESLVLFTSMIFTVTSSTIFKYLLSRERPKNMIIDYGGFSFPSGHSTMAVLFYGLLFYLIKDKIKNYKRKNIILIIFVFFGFLIICSRIYLAVHWLSDVIGGIILGTIWLLIGQNIYNKYKRKKDKILTEI